MKKIAYILLILLSVVYLQSCEDTYLPPTLEYITFEKTVFSTGVDVGGATTVEIPVYTGNIISADRTFNIDVDGSAAAAGSYTAPSSVTIPGGTNKGIISVSLTDTNLGIGVNKLKIKFIADGETTVGPATSIEYLQNCEEVTLTLNIVFDGYGSETAWNIKDALGGVVVSKPSKTYEDGQASASETITLCAGRDYTFTITDDYGDGLSYPANGSYTLSLGSTVKVTGGGDFGASETTAFDTN
jgi:hypothetical protein